MAETARRALAGALGAALLAGLAQRQLFEHIAATRRLVDGEAALAADRAAVLFADTFSNAFDTENAVAAVRVLQAAGYAVHVARRHDRALCCGRTYLNELSTADHRRRRAPGAPYRLRSRRAPRLMGGSKSTADAVASIVRAWLPGSIP